MTSPVSSSTSNASLGIGSINGIASGIQWQTMVDQIMQIEQKTQLDPVTARQTAAQATAQAWTNFQGVLGKFRDASTALGASSAFDVFTATANASPTSSRALVSATATTGASTGAFSAEVLQLARAEKIGGNVVADSTTPLNISGQFALNGVTITVAATDSLSAIRDKINAINSGTTPSGVSATILAAGSGSQLVLTSDSTGAAGIQPIDDAAGTLQSLGLADGTAVANIAASGATQTNRMWSATSAISSLIAMSVPPIVPPTASSIKVGGQVVNVDLGADSLQSIADKINAQLGSGPASVVSETVGARTAYRLQTSATVEVNSASATSSAQVLATLGFTTQGRAGTTASIGSANLFNDASNGLPVATTTSLSQLEVGTQALGLVAGDKITIAGTRGDGTAVQTSYTVVGSGDTMQNLLDAINNSTNGFGTIGMRAATASLSGGRIVLTDTTAGASQLGMSLTVTHAGGSTVSLGAFSASTGGTAGRSLELVSGLDSQVRIDGQTITRATNTISDAITGVTLNLLGAESGTAVNVSIAHDVSGITQTIQKFVTAYNNVRSWVTQNTAVGAPLANNTTASSIAQSFTSALLNTVVGSTGSLTTAAIAGLQHDKTGVLSLDTTVFQGFASTNFDDLRRLFTMSGTPSDSEVSFFSAGVNAKATATPYPVVITQAATMGSTTGSTWTTYATGGTADTMSITDTNTGHSGSISLANGDSIDSTVARLNAMFSGQKMRLTATKTAGSQIQISALDYGAMGGFTVAYTPGAGGNGTAALGINAQSYTGLNVAGTINGVAGTGRGQYLTGAKGDASDGIMLRYTGTAARSAGSLAFSIGIGGTLGSIATGFAADSTGVAAQAATNATSNAADIGNNIAGIQARLDARRAQLTQQFIAMETALSQAQSLGAALTSQINAIQNVNK